MICIRSYTLALISYVTFWVFLPHKFLTPIRERERERERERDFLTPSVNILTMLNKLLAIVIVEECARRHTGVANASTPSTGSVGRHHHMTWMWVPCMRTNTYRAGILNWGSGNYVVIGLGQEA